MKNYKLFCIACLFAALLTGCRMQEKRQVRLLENFTTDLQENYSTYNDEQWNQSMVEFEMISESLEGDFSVEQIGEIARLEGQCAAIYFQYFFDEDHLNDTMHKLGVALGNSFDGMKSVVKKEEE